MKSEVAEPGLSWQLGLTGWPVVHSLSPRLQEAALASAGLSGTYRLYPVADGNTAEDQLRELIAQLRQGWLQGLNVTLPYKQRILPLVDALSPNALAIGAVNTLYRQGDRVWGENTDAPGFLCDLNAQGMVPQSLKERQALVLGAGGAARAVVYALVHEGWQVTVTARRIAQAGALAWGMSAFSPLIQALPLETALRTQDYRLVVQATPVGMDPHPEFNPWPEEIPLPPQACVYDLVYTPQETCLVRRSRACGLKTCNGLGMLIEQAALAFELFTGFPADRSAMRAAVAEDTSVEKDPSAG